MLNSELTTVNLGKFGHLGVRLCMGNFSYFSFWPVVLYQNARLSLNLFLGHLLEQIPCLPEEGQHLRAGYHGSRGALLTNCTRAHL